MTTPLPARTGEAVRSSAQVTGTFAHDAGLAPPPLQEIVQRLAEADRGMLRQLVPFGSRARGTAHANSDVDILVLVQPPADAPWSPRARLAEEARLLRVLVGLQPDELFVRTLRQYADAQRTWGGPGYAAAHCGTVLYAAATETPSTRVVAPESVEQVRRRLAAEWMAFARDRLGEAGLLLTARTSAGISADRVRGAGVGGGLQPPSAVPRLHLPIDLAVTPH